MSEEKEAEHVIMSKLEGLKLTGLHICLGDDDHGPHIDLEFQDMELRIVHGEMGIAAILFQKKPDAASGVDFHHSPGVLQ